MEEKLEAVIDVFRASQRHLESCREALRRSVEKNFDPPCSLPPCHRATRGDRHWRGARQRAGSVCLQRWRRRRDSGAQDGGHLLSSEVISGGTYLDSFLEAQIQYEKAAAEIDAIRPEQAYDGQSFLLHNEDSRLGLLRIFVRKFFLHLRRSFRAGCSDSCFMRRIWRRFLCSCKPLTSLNVNIVSVAGLRSMSRGGPPEEKDEESHDFRAAESGC